MSGAMPWAESSSAMHWISATLELRLVVSKETSFFDQASAAVLGSAVAGTAVAGAVVGVMGEFLGRVNGPGLNDRQRRRCQPGGRTHSHKYSGRPAALSTL